MYQKASKELLKKIQLRNNIRNAFISLIVWHDPMIEIEDFPRISLANHFLRAREGREREHSYDADNYVDTIIRFLNFLEKLGFCFEKDWNTITFGMAMKYFREYCETPTKDGDERSLTSRRTERRYITYFLINIKQSNPNCELQDHWLRKKEENKNRRGRASDLYEMPIFKADSLPAKEVVRECPLFFVEETLKQARIHNKQVWMLIVLMICAGLRPSEGCNVRTKQSIYGPGYRVTFVNQGDNRMRVVELIIDLSRSEDIIPLREDVVAKTAIKKPRPVSARMPEELYWAICEYLDMTKHRNRRDTGPLVCTARKQNTGYNEAMTYENFRNQFKNLCNKYVIPELIKQGGIKSAYAKKLVDNHYGPHFFREFFSVCMATEKETWANIMHFRGDSGVDSAVRYIIQGDLPGMVKRTSDDIADIVKGNPPRTEEKPSADITDIINGNGSRKDPQNEGDKNRRGKKSFPKRI